MSAKKKAIAVSALALGGIAGATGTAHAAQGGVATEAPSGTTTAVAEKPRSASGAATTTASPEKKSSAAAQATAPAPTISQAEKSTPRASTGTGQGGVATELPSHRKAEAKPKAAPAQQPTQAQVADTPARTQVNTPARTQTQTTSAPAATATQTSNTTARQAPATTPATATTTAAVQKTSTPTAQQPSTDYADVAATGTGQGGVATELPASDPKPDSDTTATAQSDDGVVDAAADDTRVDYSERVEAASQTPTSGTFTPAAPTEPAGQMSTYAEPRQNGVEVGIVGDTVATGTAVEVSDTTSHVSNTTTGGGEQATAAQTWDASNGNYNATWATTGGVSGTGGFSATNEQTAPNVGAAGVDGQWSSPDGASSVSITGGATLQNYGVHDASGSIEISTPIGNMAFTF